MKGVPTNPLAFGDRVFAALAADLSDAERFKRDGFAQTDALREISRQTKKGRS